MVIVGIWYPAVTFIAERPLVSHNKAVEVHAGRALGQTAKREPSFMTFDLPVGATGAENRKLPTGGAAYGILEKLKNRSQLPKPV